jgi:queuine tRNA-ribosyltransferase
MRVETIRNDFTSLVEARHSQNSARVLCISTPHGIIHTPAFMPVGTYAVVKFATPELLKSIGVQIILGGNTYHMMSNPGLTVIEDAGGMHRFMGWSGPMLTDSGGFQVFSLSRRKNTCRIYDDGAEFQDPLSGKTVRLTPESSIEAQRVLGSDIIMALDQCTPDEASHDFAQKALDRTHQWLRRSQMQHVQRPLSVYGLRQALFGIVQGGAFRDLRLQSAEYVVNQELDGVAIGGESIGYNMERTMEILSWVQALLPRDKPRYSMGVGLSPQDLVDVVSAGIDIFDCVAPTRNARHGSLYSGRIARAGDWLCWESSERNGRIDIGKAQYAHDQRPISEDCTCITCSNHSRSYVHYLFKTKSLAYQYLSSIHNLSTMEQVCAEIRKCILQTK